MTRKISRELAPLTGEPERTTPSPPPPKEPGEIVGSRLLQCSHCNAFVDSFTSPQILLDDFWHDVDNWRS
ncbi:MAG: hypothetical protein RBS57_17445 [Desulforhabdus sp.]|nr:hypothetical protein [Desulforhabdus sp.]